LRPIRAKTKEINTVLVSVSWMPHVNDGLPATAMKIQPFINNLPRNKVRTVHSWLHQAAETFHFRSVSSCLKVPPTQLKGKGRETACRRTRHMIWFMPYITCLSFMASSSFWGSRIWRGNLLREVRITGLVHVNVVDGFLPLGMGPYKC
jgi:hypothetical protein